MTIEYDVSQNGKRIDTFPKGALDIKETIDYFDRLKNDKKIKQGAIEIVYFRDVTEFKLSCSENKKITESYQEPKAMQVIDATIFVCETSLAYGIGRMLQTFHEITNPEHTVIIVRSSSELEDVLLKVKPVN
jgi:hypothetical protein